MIGSKLDCANALRNIEVCSIHGTKDFFLSPKSDSRKSQKRSACLNALDRYKLSVDVSTIRGTSLGVNSQIVLLVALGCLAVAFDWISIRFVISKVDIEGACCHLGRICDDHHALDVLFGADIDHEPLVWVFSGWLVNWVGVVVANFEWVVIRVGARGWELGWLQLVYNIKVEVYVAMGVTSQTTSQDQQLHHHCSRQIHDSDNIIVLTVKKITISLIWLASIINL